MKAYPNPFKESATIEFAIPATEYAKVEVFNYMGSLVAVLFEGTAEEQRLYSIQFDVIDYPFGLYYIRLNTAINNQVQKILLVK